MSMKRDLMKKEAEAFKLAEDAYFKACNTSDPQDWMTAALYAQQHRNVLVYLRRSFPEED